MKNNITISLDSELVTKLKQEENYSDLINEQMNGYYNSDGMENMKILKQKQVDLKRLLKEKRKEQRLLDKKIEKIQQKEIKILEIKEKNLKKELRQGVRSVEKRKGRTIIHYN